MDYLSIIYKYYPEDDDLRRLLLRHSRQVADRCLEIARKHKELPIDVQFLEEAAMLHDIGIRQCDAPGIHCHGTEPYIRHGMIGAEMLRHEGYERHARVCERHTGTGLPGYEPETLEEQIVCYADKFYSKSDPDHVRSVVETAQSLEKFGREGVDKFLSWSRQFTLVFLLAFVLVFMMAEVPHLRFPSFDRGADSLVADSVPQDTLPHKVIPLPKDTSHTARISPLKPDSIGIDSLIPDTAGMDSLQLAIWKRNKAVDDSLYADSLNRQRKNGIDAPVVYSAEDSMTYDASTGLTHLYGKSHVQYENMDLESDQIFMSMDSSLVHATGSCDSTGNKFGTPIFKMGNDTYETDTMAFNFKSKKGLIQNVYTEQDDGFMTSEISKRGVNGDMFLYHGRYTTCDLPHPDFYFAMSRAKVRPGKDVVFGPTYLVVADVPLPFAVPYGFFPFTKNYSSGFIMPTYGDETSRGFYLRDGGYYFAISDKMDLKLLGEIYTKGSWGIKTASNYRKRYKYNGSFLFDYQVTINGEKNMPDYTKETSFSLKWQHAQDAKAIPYRTLRASVNYASQSFEQNNLTSIYNPQARTQTTRTSSVSLGFTFSNIGLSVSTDVNATQNMRDSTVTLTLPNVVISLSKRFPFKRKKSAGAERWYEKISLTYTGHLENRIQTKEDKLFKSSLTKDWKNGFSHNIKTDASFTVLKYLNLTAAFNFNDKMLTQKYKRSWDSSSQKEVVDTLTGFYNIYDWNTSLTATTKIYGFFIPNRKIFGNRIDRIRHVFTPQVSFNYTPSFGGSRYGYYETYLKTDLNGNVSLVEYSPYTGTMFSPPSKNMSGSISMSISNNVEMKWRNKEDSLVKVSLIDELSANMSYDIAAKEKPWSDLNTNIRLKFGKNTTFSLNARFATYAYEADSVGAKPYVGNRTEYSYGRFGRFQGMSKNLSYTLDNKKVVTFFKKLFGKATEDDKKKDDGKKREYDTGVDTNIDPDMEGAKHAVEKESAGMADTDEDGYMKFSIPWTFTIGYGITMRENTSGTFNYSKMRYPYKFTQNMNFAGSIRISDGWNISFSSGYDFETKKISMTTASLSRDLHCFNMSCSMVLAPYTSYNFSFRCNAATLTDALKYDKRSGYTNAVKWY